MFISSPAWEDYKLVVSLRAVLSGAFYAQSKDGEATLAPAQFATPHGRDLLSKSCGEQIEVQV
jgi:hypothetical protein